MLERLTESYAPAFADTSRAIFLHFVNVSLRHNYVYVATPKVACSSMLQTLQRLELSDHTFLHSPPSDIHDRRFSPLLCPLQLADFRAFTQRPEVINFCFVRNPYDRLLSCYLEKVRDGHLSARFLAQLGRDQGPVTFDEFIEVICNEDTVEMDSHYGIQYLQTFQDYIPYKFVGRFENLKEDLTSLSQKIGVDLSPYLVRIDPHKTDKKDFQFYFSKDLIDLVRRKYYQDFEAFDYGTDLPV